MATSALERIRALRQGAKPQGGGTTEDINITEEVKETPLPQPKALPSVGKERNLAVAEKVLGSDTGLLKQAGEQEAQLEQLLRDRKDQLNTPSPTYSTRDI